MLKSIVIVTISVLNLAAVEDAYREHLDYTTARKGQLSEDIAAAWNAPEMAGREYVVMRPASNKKVYLRFIENPATMGHVAMTTHGWAATELLVQDPDQLAEDLAGSPFAMIGPPADLWAAPDAPRAMQVRGSAGEILYLTRNNRFDYEKFIDRVFIMVLAGPSMDVLRDYYSNTMGLEVGEPMPFKLTIASRAQGMLPDTIYPLALATISKNFLIELDEYPDEVEPRTVTEGFLPPGTAMVSFRVDNLDDFDVEWRADPRIIAEQPYGGRRTAVTVGPAGEWLELIQTK